MTTPVLTELTVAELLARWPQAIPVFLRRQMACVGCTMSPFETLADVTAVYGIPLPRFVGELQQAIQPLGGTPVKIAGGRSRRWQARD